MGLVPTLAARRRAYQAWALILVVLLGVGLGWWSSHHHAGPSGSTTAVARTARPTAAAGGVTTSPGPRHTPDSGLPTVAESRLPSQGRATLALIHAGGPFPYTKDGAVFENRERLLPREPSGYYHEYTVPKPGESDRGPWRLIAGADGDVYWTADHYDSFRQVKEGT